MKLLIKLFLLAGLFFCGSRNSNGQDLFSRFEKRLEASQQKPIEQYSKTKHKKKKKVGRILSESTADYSLLLADNSSFPSDTVARKRAMSKTRNIISDSLMVMENNSDSTNLLVLDSIPKKKKKRKNEESNFYSDSMAIDSLTQQDFVADGNTKLIGDSVRQSIQVLIMDSAYAYLYANKYDTAVIYFTKIIENYPATDEYKLSFLGRAKSKSGLNDFVGALHDLDIFISIDNCGSAMCSESYYQRGLVNFKLQNYPDAINDFSKVIADSTFINYKYCFFYRAFALGESGKYIQSVQDYTKFLNLDKFKSVSSAEALYYRGFYKVKLDDNRGAISDYDLAIEMYSGAYESSKGKNQIYFQKLIDTYITRGLAYAEIKKWDEAIASYNTVIKMKPDYATAYHLKGLSEIGKGELDAGCLDLSKAGELGSNDAYNDIKLHCK